MSRQNTLAVGSLFLLALASAPPPVQAQPQWGRGPAVIRSGDRCLEVFGPQAQVNGARVQVGDCNGSPTQQWRHEHGGRWINMANNRCLDLNGPDTGFGGGRIQVWDCNGSPNQRWRYENGGLIVQADGRCMDVHGRDTGHNGGRVQSYDCHFGANQQWSIEPLMAPRPMPPPPQPPAPMPNCESRLGPFAWSCSRPLPVMSCERIIEPSDPNTWQDNYFCSDRPLGMRWSYAGPIPGMHCTQIAEPSDPHAWNDNFLCLPQGSPYRFQWSNAGPIPGLPCVPWNEPADPHTWQDNFLCWAERGGGMHMPPPPPPPPPTRDVEAGPLWTNDDAARRCPQICGPGSRWTGGWRTTIPGRMSICACSP